MIKKVVLLLVVLLTLALVTAELLAPTIIEHYAKKQIAEIGVDEVEVEITSSRPHLLKILTNDLEGTGIVHNFSSVLNFQQIEVQFSNMGLHGGDLEFTGFVSEAELSRYLKTQWDENVDVALTDGMINITIPVNLIFVQIEASFNGNFQVEPNNKVVFVIENVNMNLPGLHDEATDFFLNNYKLDFSLGNIPYVEINSIEVKEGYLVIVGLIDQ